ncbi:conserved membrane hypothetical protein [Hyella patelloides LEGE 07179]|uniref:DUF4079 domain-containing protein n=1 Tax=Hyella patelloides LEGE 07179 TaxID=945734 RepID=A0A563VNS8_9CYAN|nr:DUF4079 domain-containing protein [Hyella patelloides]VEP13078.1 conserved membrane hypothetical protein [Hyella patelloides LEGE 07179]
MNFEIPETVKTWSQFFHPLVMWILFFTAIYSLYLGWQIRRTRNAPKELRQELIKQNFSNRHHRVGSILLALMVLGALGGMAVTYINNGKLIVGPHLLAGLGMVGLIATSVSLVPYMQKGNSLARYSHISLNGILLALFGWQAITGVQIVQKIISNL